MTLPTIPALGSTNWYTYAQALDTAVRGGGGGVVSVKDAGAVGDGTTDDTTAIQSVLTNSPTGSTIVLPGGYVFRCTGGLTIPSGKRYTLTGGGELRFNNSTHLAASGFPFGLHILGSGTTLRGIRITNPSEIKGANTFGNSTYNQAVQIEAHEIRIIDCDIDRWQQGVAVHPTGEWQDIQVIGNRISNVLGRGDGAVNTTSINGEDGGDGVVVWGARAVVANNIVYAKAGSDARIGIHCENLGEYEVTPTAYSNTSVTFTGNVVFGPFRRGIATEGISHAVISNNVVWDATWWGIAVIQGDGNVITGNTIRWTRTSSDNQGAAWNPIRSAIHLRREISGAIIANNTVTVTGSAAAYVLLQLDGTRVGLANIHGNTFNTIGTGTVANGMQLEGVDSPMIKDNYVGGFTNVGIYLYDTSNFFITGNRVKGKAGVVSGIDVGGTSGVCSGNDIQGVPGTAINAPNQTANGSMFNNNNIIGTSSGVPTSIGIELFGTASSTSVVGNHFINVTSKLSNAGGAIVNVGNN